MEITGKSTVHPALFLFGKAAGYFTWVALTLVITGVDLPGGSPEQSNEFVVYPLLIAGMLLILVSSFTLGRSIRIGLPTGSTKLRTSGIYRLSRNPMYVGLHLITLASILLILKWWVILPGLFSIYTYHRIIRGEEIFLEERFGYAYLAYRMSTRRYL